MLDNGTKIRLDICAKKPAFCTQTYFEPFAEEIHKACCSILRPLSYPKRVYDITASYHLIDR